MYERSRITFNLSEVQRLRYARPFIHWLNFIYGRKTELRDSENPPRSNM